MSAQFHDAIGDSIDIAHAFDSGYVMPAAVTLRSIAGKVQGDIILYTVNCGLRT